MRFHNSITKITVKAETTSLVGGEVGPAAFGLSYVDVGVVGETCLSH